MLMLMCFLGSLFLLLQAQAAQEGGRSPAAARFGGFSFGFWDGQGL